MVWPVPVAYVAVPSSVFDAMPLRVSARSRQGSKKIRGTRHGMASTRGIRCSARSSHRHPCTCLALCAWPVFPKESIGGDVSWLVCNMDMVFPSRMFLAKGGGGRILNVPWNAEVQVLKYFAACKCCQCVRNDVACYRSCPAVLPIWPSCSSIFLFMHQQRYTQV